MTKEEELKKKGRLGKVLLAFGISIFIAFVFRMYYWSYFLRDIMGTGGHEFGVYLVSFLAMITGIVFIYKSYD